MAVWHHYIMWPLIAGFPLYRSHMVSYMNIQHWRYHQPELIARTDCKDCMNLPVATSLRHDYVDEAKRPIGVPARSRQVLHLPHWRHVWWLHRATWHHLNSTSRCSIAEGSCAQSMSFISKHSQRQNVLDCYMALRTVHVCPLNIPVTHLPSIQMVQNTKEQW